MAIISVGNYKKGAKGSIMKKRTLAGLAFAGVANYIAYATYRGSKQMGGIKPYFTGNANDNRALLTNTNRIEYAQNLKAVSCRSQMELESAAYAIAYVLRHFGEDIAGGILNSENCCYPKDVKAVFAEHGFRADYYTGNIEVVKNVIVDGDPVIVMLWDNLDKKRLRYAVVVGFDEESMLLVDADRRWADCEEACYNRKLSMKEFYGLWHTGDLQNPMYRNTFFIVHKDRG